MAAAWPTDDRVLSAFIHDYVWGRRRVIGPMSYVEPEHAAIFAEIRTVLLDSYTEDGAAIWLNHGNRNLDGARPIDLINQGQGIRVRSVAYAIEGEA